MTLFIKNKQKGESSRGIRNIVSRDRYGFHDCLMDDYFSEHPMYNANTFQKMFSMSEELFYFCIPGFPTQHCEPTNPMAVILLDIPESAQVLHFALEALRFVFKDLAFALEALHFVFKDLAFCLGSTAFCLQRPCILPWKHCVLSSKILRFALEVLRFVYFKDLAFCFGSNAFCLLQRSCVLLWKNCVLSTTKILRFVLIPFCPISIEADIAFCPRSSIAFCLTFRIAFCQASSPNLTTTSITTHLLKILHHCHFIILQSFIMTTSTVTSSTDNQMHNNIMAAGSRDRLPMLATGRYPQWRSRFLRYINTRPNGDALRKCILSGPYKPTTVLAQAVDATDDSLAIPKHTTKEVNELRAERLARNANPLALVATTQANQDPYYLTSKSHKSYAPSPKPLIPTRSHTTTRHKGKEIAKPITPPSESASEEDNDPEQAQRDKDMQKSLALIAKYFKKIYKPTNNNIRTSSNSRNKNVDTTPRYKNDNQSGQFGNHRTVNVAGARENIGNSAYHKEKMLMCKQAEQGVPLQAKQYDWLVDTDEEIDEQELEAHYNYMAKIQEVPTADTGNDSEPLKYVQIDTRYNVFANDLQHSEQSESVSNTCLMEKDDSNVIPNSPDMCDDDIQNDQNNVESDDERVVLANLIANLKLDVDENKKIQKQLKKANTTLAQELKECKTIIVETSKTLGESNSVRDSCLVALQNKQTEFEKYKAFNDRTVDYDKLEQIVDNAWIKHSKDQFRAPIAQDMEILIQTCLMPLAIKTQNDSFIFVHELKQEMHADLKYVESLKKEIDELKSDKAKFSNMYDMILQECVSNDVMCSYLLSLSDLNALDELQCLYLHKVKECNCLAQKLSNQTESVSKEVHSELLQRFAKVVKHSISIEIALQKYLKAQLQDKNIAISELKKLIEKGKGKYVETKFDKPSVVRQPNAQRIPKPSVLDKPAPFSNSIEIRYFPNPKSVPKTNVSEGLSKPVTAQTLPQTARQAQEMHADLKYVESLKKEIDELKSDKAEFSNMYDVIMQECVSKDVMCSYLMSLSDLDALDELQCLYLHKVKECDCLAQKLSKQTESIVQLIIFIVDSGCTKHMTGNLKLLCNFVEKFLGTVRFGNDQFAPILGYEDLVQGNVTINRVYYVKGLNQNLFSVESTSSTLLCLMAKATPTQAWLWHQRLLSHLTKAEPRAAAIYVSVLSISILILREDLSRNLELTESTPSLGEDCWELLKRLSVSLNFGFDYACVFPTRMTRNCISRRKIRTPALRNCSDNTPVEDTLTQSMNYQPVVIGNQPNTSAGIQEHFDADKAWEGNVQQYVLFPLWSTGFKDLQNTDVDATFEVKEPESEVHVSSSSSAKTKKHDDKTKREAKGKSPIELSTGVRDLSDDFEEFFYKSTNGVNATNSPVTTVGPNSTNNTNTFSAAGPSNNVVSLNFELGRKSSFVDPSQYPDDPDMPVLEDITYSDDEKDVCAKADFSNLETNITVSPIPTTRVHKNHHVTQIIEEPKRVHQALKDPSWIEAMQEELLQFKMQKIWVLVDLPKGKRAIGSKWVFRNKKDEIGIVVRNKARLVAQGHTQDEGIDYEEVFAPVARIEAIRLFLTYDSFMGFMVYQTDVKSTFLYGTIEEEVYVCQPPGFEDPDYPDKGKIDQTLFIKRQKGDILLVQVYVDGIIFGSTNKELCKAIEKLMKDKFQKSSMGELTLFLGLQVKQKEDGIFISQDKYVSEILRKFGLTDGKSASIPIDTQKPLLKDLDGKDVDVHTYRSMIGSLMYLTLSRPDIMFAVCACACAHF
nr:hypothetical protein [Tanacetum cinerariifolium]